MRGFNSVIKFYHAYKYDSTLKRAKKDNGYLLIPAAFDIETTTKDGRAYMYVWQFCIGDNLIFGRAWRDFFRLLSFIRRAYGVLPEKRKLIIWVHNFSFEWEFLKKRIPWAIDKFGNPDVFATSRTEILKAVTPWGIEFRDSYAQSGYSLAVLARNYCRTQKMVGDLDYKVLRNSKTPLTEKERGYCMNDAIILKEYAEYLYQKFGGDIPLTKTGVVRCDVKRALSSDPHCDIIRRKIYEAFPSENFYKKMMAYAYMGGFTHANYLHAGVTISEPMESFDFKSAYPSACFDPMPTYFRRERPANLKKYSDVKKWAFLIDVTFEGVRSASCHRFYSASKAIELTDYYEDNGRIIAAGHLRAYLTEMDFNLFKKFYTFEKMTVNEFFVSKKEPLPRFMRLSVAEYYAKKNSLKKGTPEYMENKEKLNSIYGMTVTGLFHDRIIFDKKSGEMEVTEGSCPWYKIRRSQFLLPQWGVWIAATCRYNLLSLVYQIGEDCVYCDTDSAKIIHPDRWKGIIEKFNNEIIKRNANLESEGYHIGKLGIFDDEGGYKKFKTLGAKRYIDVTDSGKVEVTIAGLPKNALKDYCEKNNLDIFQFFTDKMLLSVPFAGKMTTKRTNETYSDIITDSFGNCEKMTELSGVALVDIPFQLTMTSEYIRIIERAARTGRIY